MGIRKHNMIQLDPHIHTVYSGDATGTPEKILKQANAVSSYAFPFSNISYIDNKLHPSRHLFQHTKIPHFETLFDLRYYRGRSPRSPRLSPAR